MDPLSITASIAALLQLSGVVFMCLSNVKSASKDREKCADEILNLQKLLLRLKLRLDGGDSNTPWYTEIHALAADKGPFDQYRQCLQELQDNTTAGGRLKMFGEALIWKFKKEDIERILAQMESLKSLIQIALQNDHFILSLAIRNELSELKDGARAIKNDTDTVRAHMTSVSSGVDVLNRGHDRAKFEKLAAWLSPFDSPAHHADIISRRQEGTGQWFIDTPEFNRLLKEPNETLFCTGIPGAGKTIIAGIAVEHLSDVYSGQSIGTAYLYCNYKTQENQTATGLLAILLKQLFTPGVLGPVEELYNKCSDKGMKPTCEDIFNALNTVTAEFETTFIVIDALDECSNEQNQRSDLLAQLRALQSRMDVRLMVTSREIPDIVDEFRETMYLQIHAHDEDIKRFFAGQVERLPACIRRDTGLRKIVEDSIIKAADGMFLLARLHLDTLLDKRTKSKVLLTLKSLTNGSQALEKAYNAAIDRIKSQMPEDAKLAMRVLYWLSSAKRVLTTQELCHALAVEEGDIDLDIDNIPIITDILAVCAGLVNVDKESDIIRLVHYTAQEYFDNVQADWNPGGQLDIGMTCMRYLAFDIFKSGPCLTDDDLERRLEKYAFLSYASNYWGDHIEPIQSKVCEFACHLLRNEHIVSTMAQVLGVLTYPSTVDGYSQKYVKRLGFHVAAGLGLDDILKELLGERDKHYADWIDHQDSDGYTALMLAAILGHETTVELLLNYGANTNIQGGVYGHALQAASSRGNEQMVRTLLDHGADVNAQGGLYDTALQAACEASIEGVVDLLLQRNARINLATRNSNSALRTAVRKGNKGVVHLLLDHGADLVGVNEPECSPLDVACQSGCLEIIKLLIDRGANLNAIDHDGQTPLSYAFSIGDLEAALLLLEEGADVTIENHRGNTAVLQAARKGYIVFLKRLVAKGVKLNQPTKKGDTPLRSAIYANQYEVVKFLLEKTDAYTITGGLDGVYGTIMQMISYKGYLKLVRWTHNRHPSSISLKDPLERTPLHFAAMGGHVETFRYLLSTGLDPTTVDVKGDDILCYAALGGSVKVLKTIQHEGFKPQCRYRHWSPLHWACRTGNMKAVKVLVDNYPDALLSSRRDIWTPLAIAIMHGHKKLVDSLPDFYRSKLGPQGDANQVQKHIGQLCDGCHQAIFGTRFHCLRCSDFDYCFMCKPLLEKFHEGHEWKEIQPKNDTQSSQ